MKARIKILVLLILIATSFGGCKALDSLLPKDYNNEIAMEKIEGRYVFQINYDPQYVRHVYLDNVRIRPGVKYYVKGGKYWLRYIEEEKYRIALLFSRDSYDDDGPSYIGDNYENVERVIMNEDKIINIEGKRCRIDFQVGTGWD